MSRIIEDMFRGIAAIQGKKIELCELCGSPVYDQDCRTVMPYHNECLDKVLEDAVKYREENNGESEDDE